VKDRFLPTSHSLARWAAQSRRPSAVARCRADRRDQGRGGPERPVWSHDVDPTTEASPSTSTAC